MRVISERCARCAYPLDFCFCEHLVPIPTRTRVVILMHRLEARWSSNTGRMVRESLPNSEIRLRGHRDGSRPDLEDLRAEPGTSLLLYPTPDAVELSAEFVAGLALPVTLVVPDGTWRQAAKVLKREPALAQTRRVKLPPGETSEYQLRREHRADGLSTCEAIARALALLEADPEPARKLLEVFKIMVERGLRMRGRRPEFR